MGDKLSVNPWIGMWIRPRETIRAILAYNKRYLLPLLYWIYGFPLVLQFAQNISLGDRLSLLAIVAAGAVGGIVAGFVGINLAALLFQWTGRWIGGAGSFQDIRAALAWASVPNVVGILIWVTEMVVFGRKIFSLTLFQTPIVGSQLTITYACTVISILIMVWGIVILLKALAEAQQFSAWKALLNVFLPVIVVLMGVKVLVWLLGIVSNVVH